MNINTVKNKDYKDCFTFQNFKVRIQNISNLIYHTNKFILRRNINFPISLASSFFTPVQIYFKYLIWTALNLRTVSNGADNDKVTRVWLDRNSNNFSPSNESFRIRKRTPNERVQGLALGVQKHDRKYPLVIFQCLVTGPRDFRFEKLEEVERNIFLFINNFNSFEDNFISIKIFYTCQFFISIINN